MGTSAPPLGVTAGVWVNDQLTRLERILESLKAMGLTIDDRERLERALVRAHEWNNARVREQVGTDTGEDLVE